MAKGAAIPVYSRDICIIKLRNFYSKYHRVPTDYEFRYESKKYNIPTRNTLLKYCPGSKDEIFSEACGVESCSDLLQKYIHNSGSKRILYVRGNDLHKLSSWAPTPLISKWLSSHTGQIIAGYTISLFSNAETGNGYLFKLIRGAANE